MDPNTPTDVTPAQIPAPNPQIPRDNHGITIAAMAVFVLLALGAVAFLYYQNQQLKTMLATYQSTPIPTASQAPNGDLANWKTYTNIKYNYSFKYANTYKVDQNGMTSVTPEVVANIVAFDSTVSNTETTPRFAVNMMSIRPGDLQTQMQKHFKKVSTYKISAQYKQQVMADQGYAPIDNSVIEEVTPITFAGLNAFEYVINGNTVNDGTAEYLAKGQGHKYIWVQNGKDIFLIHLDLAHPTDQILSTFKFLVASPSPTAGVACTMEVKLCPDGSSVGRTGPNCEFAPCPTSY